MLRHIIIRVDYLLPFFSVLITIKQKFGMLSHIKLAKDYIVIAVGFAHWLA